MGSATPVHGAHGMSGVPGRKAELWICCGCAQVVTRCQSCSLCHKSCCLAQRSAECSSPQVSLIFLFNHPLTVGTRESTKKTSRINVQHQGKKHFHPVSLAAAGRMLQFELALSHQLKKSRENRIPGLNTASLYSLIWCLSHGYVDVYSQTELLLEPICQ